MNCEICGRRIEGRLKRVMIDGSILEVCSHCAILAEREVKEKPKSKLVKTSSPKIERINIDDMEVILDYATTIKKARERMGLSQDDLAQKIKEKASVIKLIESGRMKPNMLIGKKLERALKITLFTTSEDE
ncbi:MAG: multiprotein bridging factor aMBF1 [Nitrososphaeria archaeon]